MSENRNQPANDRRECLQKAGAAAVSTAMNPTWMSSASRISAALPPDDASAIRTEIEKRHDESVRRLQTWIKQPSIAAENRGMNEGCELTMEMLRDAGFQQVSKSPTDGQPGIFATRSEEHTPE